MREKRVWSTRENDAESKETAAFEATVAAAKDTAAKSGAFLSTAKSDLTDHHRWLQAQSVAVERDRMRHERWLQRQRDQRVAIARKERTSRRREIARQQALLTVQQALYTAALFIRSLVLLLVAKIAAGIKFMVAQIAAFFVWFGGKVGAGAAWGGAKLSTSARAGGSALAAGSSVVAAKAGVIGAAAAGATGRSAARGFAVASAKASAFAGASKQHLAAGYAWGKSQISAAAPQVSMRVAEARRQMGQFARAGAAQAGGVLARRTAAAPNSEAQAAAVEIYGPHLAGAEIDGRPANEPWTPPPVEALVSLASAPEPEPEVYGPFYEGFWVGGVSPNEPRVPALPAVEPAPVAPRVETENALWSRVRSSSDRLGVWAAQAREWAAQTGLLTRTRDADLSQMLIIAGAVLLVCGGLLLGGGLIMRFGTGTASASLASEEADAGIAWSFDDPDRPLPERAVFTLSGTPESFRINGLSVSGTNLSGHVLTDVSGVIKPDVRRPELKLTLKIDKKAVATKGDGDADGQSFDIVAANTVPPHAPFRLVFEFPPEAMDGADGITMEDFFEAYGGLVLKLRYEVDGTERSLIQYLSPEMLRSQLDEVSASADG
ncbi:MAG: hypothetical protein R3D01_09315 [Hyphomicrobiales bacterium]